MKVFVRPTTLLLLVFHGCKDFVDEGLGRLVPHGRRKGRSLGGGWRLFAPGGLTGEVRAISHADIRVSEIKKMGFGRCLIPKSNLKRMKGIRGIDVIGADTLEEAMEELF